MYYWNINALKKHIRENGLSEAQLFYYVLLFVGLTAIGVEVVTYLPVENPNSWNYIESALNLCIPVIGTAVAYRVNHGAEGRNFAAKYFSIGFVVLMRFLVYLIPVIVVYILYYALTIDWSAPDVDQAFDTGWFEVLLFSSWYAAYYGIVAKHIRDTAEP